MASAESSPEFRGTGRFHVVRRLGEGGMGVVYEALDRERNARVALKTLRTMNPEQLLALKHEFRALQDVTHPNLVTLGELIEDDDRWFFTMELVEGSNVLRYVWGVDGRQTEATTVSASSVDDTPLLPSGGPHVYDETRLRYALTQLAHGLNALHAARKVHRDIKPANVLVEPDGRVVVLDFGLAFDTQRDSGWEPRFAGTVGYMAPEVFTSGTIGKAGDWYAAGVLLFEALTGRLPFDAPTRLALLDAQQRDGPAPSEFASDVPRDLDQLCQELLRLDPERRPDGAEVLRRLGHASAPEITLARTFVGRGGEMTRLSEAMSEVRAGRCVIVRVRGDSGVGKSYLVRQFTSQLVARDGRAVILAGRCYERESVPYKALDGIVDELTGFLSATLASELPALLPPGVQALAQVFPVLRQIEAVAQATRAPDEREPQVVRAEASEALRDMLRRIARRCPLVLAIDDLHWTDADSLQLLRELVRQPGAPPVLLIATLRDGHLGHVPVAELEQAVPVAEPYDLRLGALSSADAEQLVNRLAHGVEALAAVDARSIAREAGGHPLFIHELVQHVALSGGALWGGDRALRIEDAIRARIARLDPPARAIVELVALAGSPLAQDVIARAADLPFDEFSQHAIHLRIGNLVRTRGTKQLDAIEPVHDRVREAVLGALPPARRVELHERLAGALEGAAQADPETLAHNWRGAGHAERALGYAVLAAEQATRAFAFRRAARLYQMALELGASSPLQRRELMTRLGEALANAGDGAAAADAYLTAAANAPDVHRIDLERRAAEQLLRAGHIDRGIEQVRTVLSRMGMQLPATPGRALASVLLQRALVRLRGLRFTERSADRVPAADLGRVDICWSLASLGLIDTIRGADFGARQLRLALRVGEPDRLARALATEAVYAVQMSGTERARKLLAEAARLADTNRQPHVLGIVASTTGLVEYVLGNYQLAREHLERGHRYFLECVGVAWEISATRLFALICLACEGRLDELARLLPPVLVEAEDRGDLFAATSIRVATQHVVLIAAGKSQEARSNIDDAMARWSQTGFQMQHRYALLSQVEIDLSQGNDLAAYTRLATRWREIEASMLLRIRQQRIETLSVRGRAAVAAAGVGGREARRLHAEALRHARAIVREDLPWARGQGLVIRAAVAFADARDEAAIGDLGRAIQHFESTGMALHAAAARRRLGEVLGGSAGQGELANADAWMTRAGILDQDGIVRMLAPGFGRRRGSAEL
jgi:tetratricopeptide (TPR) repeat protein